MTEEPRRWLELAVARPDDADHEALVAECLLDLGGRAVEYRGGRMITHLPEPPDVAAVVEAARDALRVVGEASLDVSHRWQEHEDWAETWKRGLDVRRITPRLVVAPSWIPVEAGPEEIVLVLDPGMAFGNAEHGTTRGCLRLLDRRVREGDRLLDVGAGSGILAIAAARLGASSVVALEGDTLAEERLRANVLENGVASRVRIEIAWADADSVGRQGPVDGIVANIESGRLRPLLPGFVAALRPGGWLILSGILAEEADAMQSEAASHGFELDETDADEAWRSLAFGFPGSGATG